MERLREDEPDIVTAARLEAAGIELVMNGLKKPAGMYDRTGGARNGCQVLLLDNDSALDCY